MKKLPSLSSATSAFLKVTWGDQTWQVHRINSTGTSKYIRISVQKNGQISIKAPRTTAKKILMALLQQRGEWIDKQLQRFQQIQQSCPVKKYLNGEMHLFLGQSYPMNIHPPSIEQFDLFQKTTKTTLHRANLVFQHNQMHIYHTDGEPLSVKTSLYNWYAQQALSLFNQRMMYLIQVIPWIEQPPLLRIRLMKTRWGSCSSVGKISLNLQLIKAPINCIDYVIIHELCHLKHHNHGKGFYQLLTQLMPDWQQHKNQLKTLSNHILSD